MVNFLRVLTIRLARQFPRVRGHGTVSILLNRALLAAGASPLATVNMKLGHRLILDLRVQSHVWAAFSGTYDDAFIKTLIKLLPDKGVFFDVGANIGFYTVPLARVAKSKQAQVVAFEPLEANAARLEANLKLNEASSYVRLEKLALSDQNGSAKLELREDFLTGGETGNAVISMEAEKPYASVSKIVSIPIGKLDDLWAGFGLDRLDLVKVDVEGHEIEFMRGAKLTLSDFRPIIQLEMNDGHYATRGIDIAAAFTEALPANYLFFGLDEEGKLTRMPSLAAHKGRDVFAIPSEKVGRALV